MSRFFVTSFCFIFSSPYLTKLPIPFRGIGDLLRISDGVSALLPLLFQPSDWPAGSIEIDPQLGLTFGDIGGVEIGEKDRPIGAVVVVGLVGATSAYVAAMQLDHPALIVMSLVQKVNLMMLNYTHDVEETWMYQCTLRILLE